MLLSSGLLHSCPVNKRKKEPNDANDSQTDTVLCNLRAHPPPNQDAWRLDARSKEDIGLAVELDPDGKAATLDSESLTGYGVSKPLRIGAQVGGLL